jgi:NAD(P)-dependent dehydrogenase (short-subunit alcohol dehydrogenase family)
MDEVNGLYEKTGAVDCLILNASVQYKEPWTEITDETFDEQFDVNVKSTLKLMQAYYPAMKEKGFGRIVTIGSVNQYRQHRELSVYSATKCAVMKIVEIVAKEVAPFGVTVNNVAPGAIATPRNESVYNDEEKRKVWQAINEYIKTELKAVVDAVFDCVPILGKAGEFHKAKYGGHPNDKGCKEWGEKLYKIIEKVAKSLIR